MDTTAQYASLGTAKAHHMPEDYYTRWEALRQAERRADLAYQRQPNTQTAQAFARAMRRLTEHEQRHTTA